MLRINQLRLPAGHTSEELIKKVKKILRIDRDFTIHIVRRSLDARKKPDLYFNYILDIEASDEKAVYRKCDKKQVIQVEIKNYEFPVKNNGSFIRPLIIGTGPAGLFCGYMLAEAGFKPVLLERGKDMAARIKDVEEFWQTGSLKEESNVQFGEGGAGTFSDGKLNTLVKESYGRNKEVLSIFVKEGAPEQILYDHKPHIGTDILSKVVVNMRNKILKNGGEIRFLSKATGFEVRGGRITSVMINETEKAEAEYVVLAPGHSARDTFKVLYDTGVLMEAKSFAVGFRVEHSQEMINLSQYGMKDTKTLGNADYKLSAKSSSGRGVYSFCMCPGGYVVNASSQQNRLCVNGMSYSGRNGENANSAIIVSVGPEDFKSTHPLSGIEFQQELEEKAFRIAKGSIPVEKYVDFIKAAGIESSNKTTDACGIKEVKPYIKGRWEFAAVHEILPAELNKAFVEGMECFGKSIPGFNAPDVLVEGVESRTSSPVRIIRDDSLQSNIRGLYPCGEGAGYAGGITSAAMDGIKVAEMIARQITERNEFDDRFTGSKDQTDQ